MTSELPPPSLNIETLSKGDVVQLKSGGPLMTIAEVFLTNGTVSFIKVNFFNGHSDFCEEKISVEVIHKVKE